RRPRAARDSATNRNPQRDCPHRKGYPGCRAASPPPETESRPTQGSAAPGAGRAEVPVRGVVLSIEGPPPPAAAPAIPDSSPPAVPPEVPPSQSTAPRGRTQPPRSAATAVPCGPTAETPSSE